MGNTTSKPEVAKIISGTTSSVQPFEAEVEEKHSTVDRSTTLESPPEERTSPARLSAIIPKKRSIKQRNVSPDHIVRKKGRLAKAPQDKRLTLHHQQGDIVQSGVPTRKHRLSPPSSLSGAFITPNKKAKLEVAPPSAVDEEALAAALPSPATTETHHEQEPHEPSPDGSRRRPQDFPTLTVRKKAYTSARVWLPACHNADETALDRMVPFPCNGVNAWRDSNHIPGTIRQRVDNLEDFPLADGTRKGFRRRCEEVQELDRRLGTVRRARRVRESEAALDGMMLPDMRARLDKEKARAPLRRVNIQDRGQGGGAEVTIESGNR